MKGNLETNISISACKYSVSCPFWFEHVKIGKFIITYVFFVYFSVILRKIFSNSAMVILFVLYYRKFIILNGGIS